MSNRFLRGLKSVVMCVALALALVAGCGGGGGGEAPVVETNPPPATLPLMFDSLGRQLPEAEFGGGDPAAAGADGIAFDNGPMASAQVTLADNAGNTRTATTDASGYYRVNVKGLTPPFVVKARRPDGSEWVSASVSAAKARAFLTININGLTDKLVGLVADSAASGSGAASSVTPASLAANASALTAARTRLVDALAAPITNAGLDRSTYDPVATPFRASGPDPHAALLQALTLTRNAQGRTSVIGTVAGSPALLGAPSGVALDRAGNMYIADVVAGVIRKLTPGGVLTLIAGGNGRGSADGPGAVASFDQPEALAVDAAGNIYVADSRNHLVRKITPGGEVSTLAGSGQNSSVDGSGRSASFSNPKSLAADAAGNVYVRDQNAVRKVSPAGVVTTVPGTSSGESCCLGGAKFVQPISVALDPAGNLYVGVYSPASSIYRISPTGVVTTLYASQRSPFSPYSLAVDAGGTVFVADENRIWRVTPDGGATLFAGGSRGYANGSGTAARFDGPRQLAVDGDGNLIVADVGNAALRKVTPAGVVTTVAGKQTGFVDDAGTKARFSGEWVGTFPAAVYVGLAGIAIDANGDAYVADTGNHAIRKVSRTGTATTLAGTGTAGFANGTGSSAAFDAPLGVAVDAAGNVYVADSKNHMVRKITATGAVSTLAGSGAAGSDDGVGALATFRAPTGIALDRSGNLYVSDVSGGPGGATGGRIRKITPGGVVSTLASASAGTSFADPPPDKFDRVFGPIVVDADGTVNFTADVNSSIFTVTAAGVVTRRKLLASDAQLAMDGQGNIYYARRDGFDTLPRFFKLTPGGAEGEVTDERIGGFSGAWLAVDNNGNLVIADKYNAVVRVLVP